MENEIGGIRVTRLWLFLVLFAFNSSCQSLPEPRSVANADAHPAMLVKIELNRMKDGTISAELSFSEPVRGFRFEQDWNTFRAATWTPVVSGIHWLQSHDHVEIAAFDEPMRMARFTIKPHIGPLMAYYDPYLEFTHGLAIEVAQFKIIPIFEENLEKVAKGAQSPRKMKYQMILGHDFSYSDSVLIEGERVPLPQDLSSYLNGDMDAYVYLGPEEMKSEGSASMLMDPSLPSWLAKHIQSSISLALKHYENVLGPRPKVKPLFFITWEPKANLSLLKGQWGNVGGSVMDGLGTRTINLVVLKPELRESDKTLHEKVQYLIFHELAHFWNQSKTEDFRPLGWMIEGGADALAYRSLRDLGFITPAQYGEHIKLSADQCGSEYKPPVALSRLGRNDNFHAAYSCGFIVSVVTEQILGSNYYTFLRKLFELRDGHLGSYDINGYFAILGKNGKKSEQVKELRVWIENPPPNWADLPDSVRK